VNALLLTGDDDRKIIFNWDNVVAIVAQSNRYSSTTASTVRVRDGSIYDVKEKVEDIMEFVKRESM
jgi:hypothetical protein